MNKCIINSILSLLCISSIHAKASNCPGSYNWDWVATSENGSLSGTGASDKLVTLKTKMTSAFNKIPNAYFNFTTSYSGPVVYYKNCCAPGDVTVLGGRKKVQEDVTFYYNANEPIQIWGLPSIDATFNIVVATVSVQFQAGVYINPSLSFTASYGKEWDVSVGGVSCGDEACTFAKMTCAPHIDAYALFAAKFCQDTIFTKEKCYNLEIRPGGVQIDLIGSAQLGCGSSVNLELDAIIVYATFDFSGTARQWSYTIYD